MKKKTIAKRKLSRQCWAMDYSFVRWMREHLIVYLHDAGKIVDLEYHKFDYNNQTYTQRQLIDKMIQLANDCCSSYIPDNNYDDNLHELIAIWNIVVGAMWW